MPRTSSLILFLATTTWVLCTSALADSLSPSASETKRHVRVLTIGNSFTENATEYLDELVDAAGYELSHQMLAIGGSPLELHASMAMAFEKDRGDDSARYSNGQSLQQALQSEPWDVVTIQQVSIKSHDAATYRPHARQLADIIHRYAPGAQLIVHQTWAYRSDDPRFEKTKPAKGEPASQREMYAGLSDAYRTITAELSAKRIPVGDAFWTADNDPKWRYRAIAKPNADDLDPPQLPNQEHSLHVGYHWKDVDGKPQLKMDGHHANVAGEYLGACVWFECLFGDSPVGNPFVPKKLDAAFATHLQSVAHQTAVKGAMKGAALNGDVIHGIVKDSVPAFDDPESQRYMLQVRASEIDPRVKEYPEIGFVFGSDKKPADLEHASVDTRVAPRGKLAIWLMNHKPGLFERWNQYGIHAIDVSYANRWFGKLAQPKPADAYARGRIRLEAASGRDVSDELDLLPPDGAAERARQLLLWLCEQNPQGKWEQFLADDRSRIRWDKVIITGSSHGSTTAARFAKHQRVDRVVMLCGPRDQDQDWQGLPSATPAQRFFGFSHVLDGGWTGDHYCRSWEMLGLHTLGPIVNVDGAQPPYRNSRRLITAADVGGNANRAHSSVTPGKQSPKDNDGAMRFDPVWRYLYTHDVNQVGEPSTLDPNCQRVHAQYDTAIP